MSETPARKLPFWLIASLLLNVVLIGFIAGAFLRGPHKPPPHEPKGGHAEVNMEDRMAIRTLMRGIAEDALSLDDERREAAKVLADVLIADPYSEEAALQAFSDFRDAEDAARRRADKLLATRLETLTPDQRKIVAEIVARDRSRRGRPGKRGEREEWRKRKDD